MEQITLQVKGMSCAHCVKAVEGALNGLQGVERALVDLKAGKVAVEYQNGTVTVGQLKQAIEDAGYDAEEIESKIKRPAVWQQAFFNVILVRLYCVGLRFFRIFEGK